MASCIDRIIIYDAYREPDQYYQFLTVDAYGNASTVVRELPVTRLRWTQHALDSVAERDIDREEAERAIHEPTSVVAGHRNRTVFLRRYHDRPLNQEMLLRVVTEVREDEITIITVYKTSRLGKYLDGGI